MGFGLHLNPRLRDWRDKRVWVVGASSGIGAALARALLDKGAWVAVSARRPEGLHAVVAGHPNGVALPMDVNRPGDWTATHHALCQAWQGVDLVVFCAAEYRPLRPWPVSADCTAICAVSGSRISPTITTSGSWRRMCRRPLANVTPFLVFTCAWLIATPESESSYSIGSSIVITFSSPPPRVAIHLSVV